MQIDLKTVFFSYVLTNIVNLALVIQLWVQSRKRFAGTGYLVTSFSLNLAGILLIFMRGQIPNLISTGVSNTLLIAGIVYAYIGLERFIGLKSRQYHNIALVVVFFLVHSYFTIVQPDLVARRLNSSIGFLLFSLQCAWLLMVKAPENFRKITRGVALAYCATCAVSIVRTAELLVHKHPATDYFLSGFFETLVVIAFMLIFIFLTYNLGLMVNRRLLAELAFQEEKFLKAFHSSPSAVVMTRLSDGKIVEVNQAFQAITGYQAAEAIGRTTLDLKLWESEGERNQMVDLLARHGAVKDMEYNFRKKSGELFPGLFFSEVISINGEDYLISNIADLSMRKLAENELVKSEAKHRILLEESTDPIFSLSSEGRYLFANKAFASGVGKDVPEIVGKTIWEVFPREEAEKRFAGLKYALETGNEKVIEVRVPRADGDRYYITTITPVKDSGGQVLMAICSSKDITARKAAEEALNESNEFNKTLLQTIPFGMDIVDQEGNILFMNDKLKNVFGNEILGRKCWSIYRDDKMQCSDCPLRREIEIGKTETYEEHKTLGGNILEVNHTGMIFQGKKALLEIFQVITERKNAEAQLQQYARELKAANETKDKFFSIIAHDLKAPLGTIIGFGELLKERLDASNNTEEAEFAGIIYHTSRQTYRLLENLLEWARLQQGTMPFKPSLVPIGKLIDETIGLLNENANLKQIALQRAVPEDLLAYADEYMLKTILRNLISNGLKFTKNKGSIEVKADLVENEVIVSVKDNGIGIEPKETEKLFNPAANYTRPGTANEPGTGLGLMLCKEFVEKHGGKIWVESVPGKGSTFYFTIPPS